VLPITKEIDRVYFGEQSHDDQIGLLDGVRSRFGRTFAGGTGPHRRRARGR
jgi:hypothetical protein